MKLFPLLSVYVAAQAETEAPSAVPFGALGDKIQDKIQERIIDVEVGGDFNVEECATAKQWELMKLGNADDVEVLKATTAESTESRYELNNNKLHINKNKKDRSMMGIIKCVDGETTLSRLVVKGKPHFTNIGNSLTNLDGDTNKRMDCAVTGYPVPEVSWYFQAIDVEEAEKQCADNACKPCLDEAKCTLEKCDKEDAECPQQQAKAYMGNSTSLFGVPVIANAVQMRYSHNTDNACPINSATVDNAEFPTCSVIKSQDEFEMLDASYRSKSQLFLENVNYAQRGKYICIAKQKAYDTTTERAKTFIWRVKDPTAALWPFLALVAEVMIVVCIILYYERAATAKNKEAEDDETQNKFIADKKEEA